ncbi:MULTISPECIES: dihydrofolate reductase family protein [Nocardiopsis]|uniref:Dihydrofolate reductase family protein n=1 Tax=Nocardiopsis changdeensis TaxID=2831969 RepID=A0ABX8BTT9_9ACTN|nr:MULTISPECIES: dihydrofolate reductase family protein [Nocardiopsis]QUX25494.1 dihydrofolate reductase family protein [Nocardiopsis changdeensis]QYX35880.1 dihydrofolate reductase family protein [Nocardiopsis sp. MT53]
MRKLIESTFITTDGVLSSPEKWGAPYWDEEHSSYAAELLGEADALLLGRQTYEGFAATWPHRDGDDYSKRINALPKYVASRTLIGTETAWNATVIKGDVAEEVARIKKEPGKNLLKFGTGELDRTLIEHGLVDEFHLWMFPVIAGRGQRLLDGLDITHLERLRTREFANGITVMVFGPK